MTNVTAINASQLFREENMKKEHQFIKGQLVKYITEEDFEDTPFEGNNAIEKTLYSGKPMFVLEQGRDCDGTPLYTLSTMPFDSVEEVKIYVANNVIKGDVFSKLNDVEKCVLLSNTARLIYIGGIAEDHLRTAF